MARRLHGVGFDIAGHSVRFEEKQLVERLASVRADQKRIGSVIEERTKLTQQEIERFFLEAQTKDAAFAAECGIVHEIRDVQIPARSPIISLVFQR